MILDPEVVMPAARLRAPPSLPLASQTATNRLLNGFNKPGKESGRLASAGEGDGCLQWGEERKLKWAQFKEGKWPEGVFWV